MHPRNTEARYLMRTLSAFLFRIIQSFDVFCPFTSNIGAAPSCQNGLLFQGLRYVYSDIDNSININTTQDHMSHIITGEEITTTGNDIFQEFRICNIPVYYKNTFGVLLMFKFPLCLWGLCKRYWNINTISETLVLHYGNYSDNYANASYIPSS